MKRDSFSCGVSSREPTLVTLRGGGCCWPELMVWPARLRVRVLRGVGARSSPLSVTGAGGGESEAQHLAPLLRRREEEEEEATGRRSRRRAARSEGRSQLPPGCALAGWPLSSHSGDCAKLPTPPPTLLRRRRRRPQNPTWQRGRARPQDAGRGGARRKLRGGPGPERNRPPPRTRGRPRGAAPTPGPAPFRPRRGLCGVPGCGTRL